MFCLLQTLAHVPVSSHVPFTFPWARNFRKQEILGLDQSQIWPQVLKSNFYEARNHLWEQPPSAKPFEVFHSFILKFHSYFDQLFEVCGGGLEKYTVIFSKHRYFRFKNFGSAHILLKLFMFYIVCISDIWDFFFVLNSCTYNEIQSTDKYFRDDPEILAVF